MALREHGEADEVAEQDAGDPAFGHWGGRSARSGPGGVGLGRATAAAEPGTRHQLRAALRAGGRRERVSAGEAETSVRRVVARTAGRARRGHGQTAMRRETMESAAVRASS
jgi:hypothetical protein